MDNLNSLLEDVKKDTAMSREDKQLIKEVLEAIIKDRQFRREQLNNMKNRSAGLAEFEADKYEIDKEIKELETSVSKLTSPEGQST